MFFIYNPTTYLQYFPKHSSHGPGRYETERAAKAQLTKAINVNKLEAGKWEVISRDAFYNDEPMVETTNVLTGKVLLIRKSLRGGCCDPGTEHYHQM